MTAKRVGSFGNIRAEEVARMMDSISGAAPDPVDLSAAVFAMSNSFVTRAVFGAAGGKGAGKGRSFREIFGELQKLGVEFNLADYFPGLGWVNRVNGVDRRIAENRRDLEGFFERVIGEHRDRTAADSGEGDIIDVLLRVQKESQLTDDQLKAILLVILFLIIVLFF